MTAKFKLIAASLAAPLAIALVTPATAAPYGNWDRAQSRDYRANPERNLENKIRLLRQDYRHVLRSGQLTRSEARTLRSRLDVVERSYAAFARNGLSRNDVRAVNWRIQQAYDALDLARQRTAYAQNDWRDYRGRR